MTGFGAADGEVGGSRVSVEVRSVNHRFFSPSIKLPGALQRWEGEVRDAMRRKVTRGHVTLGARFERDDATDVAITPVDEARFAAYVTQLRALQERYALADTLDLATILRMPDVFVASATRDELSAEAAPQLVAIVERAVDALLVMRADEGGRLVTYLDQRLAVIESALDRIAVRAPERVIEQRDRLRNAVRDLADGVSVDETRLAQEIALLADRLTYRKSCRASGPTLWRFVAQWHPRSRTAWASGWAFCSRKCSAKPTPRAARATTRQSWPTCCWSRKSWNASASRWKTSNEPVPDHSQRAQRGRQDDHCQGAPGPAARLGLLRVVYHPNSQTGRNFGT